MATKLKITRKDLKKPDEFLSLTSRLLMYGMEHSKQVLSYAAVLVFFGIVAFIVAFYFHQNEEKAQLSLSQGISFYRQGVALMEGRGDTKGADAQALAVLKNALELFDRVSKQYSGTHSGKIALLYSGNCSIRLGQTDKAIESFNKYVTTDGRPELKEIALYQIAQAYEEQNNFEKALYYYTNLTEINNNMFKGYDYEAMARCYRKIGKPDLAKRALEQGISSLQGTKIAERLKTLSEIAK